MLITSLLVDGLGANDEVRGSYLVKYAARVLQEG